MKKIILLVLILFANTALADVNNELATLKDMAKIETAEVESVLGLRSKVVDEAAYLYGVASGVNYKQKEILSYLDAQSANLDRIFNFSMLLIDKDVLPAVIIDSGNGFRLEDDKTITTIVKSYIIFKDARFVSSPPNWRDYFVEFEPQQALNKEILPKNRQEKAIWDMSIDRGFFDGLEQAEQVFESNLNTLVRDYRGMIRFHKLAMSNQAFALFEYIPDTPVPQVSTPAQSKPIAPIVETVITKPEISNPVVTKALDSMSKDIVSVEVYPAPQQEQAVVNTLSWSMSNGSIKDQLQSWGDKEGWNVVWNATFDYDLQSRIEFNCSFEDALEQLFQAFFQNNIPLRLTIYKANKVLEVSHK